MKINFWRVAAYAMYFLSVSTFIGSFILDSVHTPLIALYALVSYGIVRLEWFLNALSEAKKDDTYDEE